MLGILAAAFFQSLEVSAAKLPRPNIVLFLVDDMGWQDTTVPFASERTKFNDHYRTPNMERLAAQGMKFTRAYAAPVCSPTRVAIMTGRSPARTHVTNWTMMPDKDTSGTTPRLRSPEWRMQGWQPEDSPTLARLLHNAGYYTVHCGKWHVGAEGTRGDEPRNMGFDVNIAGTAAGNPATYQSEENFGNGGKDKLHAVKGLKKYWGTGTHLTDALTMEACAAVESATKEKKPFFLYMAHYAVHTPIQPHARFMTNYTDKVWTGTTNVIVPVEAKYSSMIEGMDASLGSIMNKLDELGVAENTIVLFASDNGGLAAHARGNTPYGGADSQNWPLREGKGSAYEGGTHIPMIVSWAKPDRDNALQKKLTVKTGAACAMPVISEDYFPTLLRWAGVKAPVENEDGRDFTFALADETANAQERPIISHYPHKWGPNGEGYQPFTEIRIGAWKAIYFFQPQKWELYNFETDIGEAHDLAKENPAKLKELASRLREELQTRGAQFPINKESGKEEPPIWP
jgi:arylsulfatase A-like enzyme